MRPTRIPATGNAQPARDSELPVSGVAGSSGKRVQKIMLALSSSARFSSQLSEIVISRRPCYRCSALACARNCIGMTNFTSFSDLRAACLDLASGHPAGGGAVAQRGAAINQLAKSAGAKLRVIPLSLEAPTADFTQQPALTEQEFLAAVATGYDAV